jgi:hydrogenase nickel incorporation protein HypA/HybF
VNLIELVEEKVEKYQFNKLRKIIIEVGKLSCIEPEALKLCFESAKINTIAQDAKLKIKLIDGSAQCRSCEHIFTLSNHAQSCPKCGAFGPIILSGNTMIVKELEVD